MTSVAQSQRQYAITLFLSSFLLFQVQPIIAKYILPWFGGGAAVWTSCMLFFQLFLLAGYTYAHFLSKYFKLSTHVISHVFLLLLSLAFLPIVPGEAWKPVDPTNPVWKILTLLFFSIGAPFLLLASTNPLLQHWIGSSTKTTSSPYRFYALSNFASLLALLSYPFLVEPFLGLKAQTVLWSTGYLLYVICTAKCAMRIRAKGIISNKAQGSALKSYRHKDLQVEEANTFTRFLWFALSTCGVILLLATTNKMTEDIPPTPFLWILPLSVYLSSFIICFDHSRWYIRGVWITTFCLSLIPMIFLLFFGKSTGVVFQISLYSMILFSACMICHGELVRLKPFKTQLTDFYLTIALGGAIGGIFVAIVAPLIFTTFLEYYVAVFVAGLLAWTCKRQDTINALEKINIGKKNKRQPEKFAKQIKLLLQTQKKTTILCSLGCVVLMSFFIINLNFTHRELLSQSRNFYGILGVEEVKNSVGQLVRQLNDGSTIHGRQIMVPKYPKLPTGYFRFDSGIGVTVRFLEHSDPLRMGVVGLGAGTIAAYVGEGSVILFYEINPAVEKLANDYFYFLKDTQAEIDIVLGDGRISLERELREQGSQQFHILVVDAFSSDAIPVHLLTKEAFTLYWKHLKPGGVLAVHISNRHFNFSPVVRNLAKEFEKKALSIKTNTDLFSEFGLDWILVTSNNKFLNDDRMKEYITPWEGDPADTILWTDDYSNLVSVLGEHNNTKHLLKQLFQILY